MSPRRSLARAGAVAALAALALTSPAAAAPTITEYKTGLTASGAPKGAVRGPDGNVWFVETSAVGRITPQGVISEFRLGLSSNPGLRGITVGPDGNLWFTENSADKIGTIDPDTGAIHEYALATGAAPVEIASGPDGKLWFTKSGAIGRITTSGQVDGSWAPLTSNSQPTGITAGPDGNLWFTSKINFGKIGRITPSGVMLPEFSGATAQPQDITVGSDGNLWFTEAAGGAGAIAKITTSGTMTEYSTANGLTAAMAPSDIVAGGDGRLYFTEKNNPGAIGAITTSGVITEYKTGLTQNSSPMGIAAGGDGEIWFTESGNTARIGRLTAPPAAKTDPAGAIANVAATLVGTVTPTSEATTYSFEYGQTTSYGSQTASAHVTANAGTAQSVSAEISGLTMATTYHFRVVATNAAGTTVGPDQTFTTLSVPAPIAYTGAADGITLTGAQLSGTVNPNGLATTYRFEWGTGTTPYGNQVPATDAAVGSDNAVHTVTQPLTGLTPLTIYHYRLVAMNSSGTTYGADRTFVAAPAPSATTGAAGGVTPSTATLSGKVDPLGVTTTSYFEWGPTASYGWQAPVDDTAAGTGSSLHAVSSALAELAPATTYHFRLVATSAGGTVYGADATFTTGKEAVVDPGRSATATTDDGAPAEDDTPRAVDPLAAPAPGPRLPAPGAPVLNKSVGVARTSGTVTVRLPGATKALPLDAHGARVPVGSVVDATNGHIALRSVKDTQRHVQTGSFWGGRFVVTQPKGPKPVTVLALAKPTERCATKAAAAAVRAKRKPKRGKDVLNKIWGRDNHGSFSTTGRYAAATVRGTEWLTADRCDGTLIQVARGAVLVTDKTTHRKILVRAGHSYLARAPR